MNGKQMAVLCIGVLVLVEWYYDTKHITYSLGIRVTVGAIAVVIMGGLIYMFRDRDEYQEDDRNP